MSYVAKYLKTLAFLKGSFSIWKKLATFSNNSYYYCKFSLFKMAKYWKNNLAICGQSYKGSTIVIYDSRVVIWGIFKSGTTLES